MIYVMQAGEDGPLKFGRAKNPMSRMAELQTGQHETLRLIASFPLPDYREKTLHDSLGEHRLRGEWFKPVKPCFDAIKLLEAEVVMRQLGYEGIDDEFCQCCELELAHALAHGWWTEQTTPLSE
jgi:hypothetical protein